MSVIVTKCFHRRGFSSNGNLKYILFTARKKCVTCSACFTKIKDEAEFNLETKKKQTTLVHIFKKIELRNVSYQEKIFY